MTEYNQQQRTILLQTARDTIQHCLTQPIDTFTLDTKDMPAELHQQRACFVTLHIQGHLRGCIGSLQADAPLIVDVVQNAYSAAFRDPRFTPLTAAEFANLTLDISVLSTPQPMRFSSEADLLAQIRPGVDGLILSDAGHRGTFLPSVWEQLPDKVEFLQHLKVKAGLPTNYWSPTLTVERYTAELIS